MTSFAVNYNWTPELIAKDKELKEKYGSAAHITPVVGRMPLKDTLSLEKAPEKKKNNKTRNILLAAGGLILTAASLYLFRGRISSILSKFSGKTAAVESNISERILPNGKKVQKIVENTEGGAKKVVMNVFDEAGNLELSKEKVITRSINNANGKKYINVKNTYNAPEFASVKSEGIPIDFNKKMSTETNKYYNTEGKLSLETYISNYGPSPIKVRTAYNANGKPTTTTLTHHLNLAGYRSSRTSFENLGNDKVIQITNKFSENGTAIKPKNS